MAELEQRGLMVYTGQTRDANQILERQSGATVDRMDVLRSMRDLVDQMRDALASEGDLDRFAALLHEGWELKRSLGFGISNDQVNEWYEAARQAGAIGGKLLGAGGGGFLLLIAPPWRHRAIREALGRPHELPFRIARHGSRLIFVQQLRNFLEAMLPLKPFIGSLPRGEYRAIGRSWRLARGRSGVQPRENAR